MKKYADLFNFTEVNSTFYEYPSQRQVESWRRTVLANFVFSVRCHQDLTHQVGLKPVKEAYEVFYKMKAICDILKAPFLVLETPASVSLDGKGVAAARDFFASLSLGDLRLVWEYRGPSSLDVTKLMADLDIVQCVDVSHQVPTLSQDVVYSRLFGKGKHNIYQFTDDELVEIDRNSQATHANKIVLTFHGPRMNSDAARFKMHKLSGKFMKVTDFVGVDSAKAVLSEDAHFPASKAELIDDQGWKVIDLTADHRVHLSTVLDGIPERTYRSVADVAGELEAVI